MIRTILKPDKNSLSIQLPNDMVGKVIEVIAFEVDQVTEPVNKGENADKAASIDKALDKYRVNLSNFKFNRDDANDYE